MERPRLPLGDYWQALIQHQLLATSSLPWSDLFVPRDVLDGVTLCNVVADPDQGLVLSGFEGEALQALQFNADGIVVALAPATVDRLPCMPGSLIAVHKLPQCTGALDEKMGGHLQSANALVVRVRVPVQSVGEQLLHGAAAVFTRGQADGMHHDQVHPRGLYGAWSVVR